LKVRTRQQSLSSVNEGYARLSAAHIESEKMLRTLPPPDSPPEQFLVESDLLEQKTRLLMAQEIEVREMRSLKAKEIQALKVKLSSRKKLTKEAERLRYQAEGRVRVLEYQVKQQKNTVKELRKEVEDLRIKCEVESVRAMNAELDATTLTAKLTKLEE
jgi:hypothetical protein